MGLVESKILHIIPFGDLIFSESGSNISSSPQRYAATARSTQDIFPGRFLMNVLRLFFLSSRMSSNSGKSL